MMAYHYFVLNALAYLGKLSSSLAIAMTVSLVAISTASAEPVNRRQLLAQDLVDGLPPPPSFGNDSWSSPQTEPLQVNDAGIPDQLYLVYVNGDSPLLLEQVKQVEPNALLQEYNGRRVILVGLFEQETDAEQKAIELSNQGIGAEVEPVSSVAFAPADAASSSSSDFATMPSLPPADLAPVATQARELEFEQIPSLNDPYSSAASQGPGIRNAAEIPDNAYYLVIPGDRDDLTQLREQVILLGAQQNAVLERERPRGPHVLVGPFVDRSAASRWNRFLRDFGMNSRVYYER
ncbi:MAG TPA: hypothetical protein ACFE0H_07070 [Elainellaceae cyanobacterium]